MDIFNVTYEGYGPTFYSPNSHPAGSDGSTASPAGHPVLQQTEKQLKLQRNIALMKEQMASLDTRIRMSRDWRPAVTPGWYPGQQSADINPRSTVAAVPTVNSPSTHVVGGADFWFRLASDTPTDRAGSTAKPSGFSPSSSLLPSPLLSSPAFAGTPMLHTRDAIIQEQIQRQRISFAMLVRALHRWVAVRNRRKKLTHMAAEKRRNAQRSAAVLIQRIYKGFRTRKQRKAERVKAQQVEAALQERREEERRGLVRRAVERCMTEEGKRELKGWEILQTVVTTTSNSVDLSPGKQYNGTGDLLPSPLLSSPLLTAQHSPPKAQVPAAAEAGSRHSNVALLGINIRDTRAYRASVAALPSPLLSPPLASPLTQTAPAPATDAAATITTTFKNWRLPTDADVALETLLAAATSGGKSERKLPTIRLGRPKPAPESAPTALEAASDPPLSGRGSRSVSPAAPQYVLRSTSPSYPFPRPKYSPTIPTNSLATRNRSNTEDDDGPTLLMRDNVPSQQGVVLPSPRLQAHDTVILATGAVKTVPAAPAKIDVSGLVTPPHSLELKESSAPSMFSETSAMRPPQRSPASVSTSKPSSHAPHIPSVSQMTGMAAPSSGAGAWLQEERIKHGPQISKPDMSELDLFLRELEDDANDGLPELPTQPRRVSQQSTGTSGPSASLTAPILPKTDAAPPPPTRDSMDVAQRFSVGSLVKHLKLDAVVPANRSASVSPSGRRLHVIME